MPTIDQLNLAAALSGAESVPIFQGANPAVKTTTQAIANLGMFHQTTVQLSSAQLLAISTTPVQIVAAPGAGFAIYPMFVTWVVIFNTTPYVYTGSQLNMFYQKDLSFTYVFNNGDSNAFTSTTSIVNDNFGAANNPPVSIANNSSVIITASAPLTSGNGSGIVTLSYMIIPVQ